LKGNSAAAFVVQHCFPFSRKNIFSVDIKNSSVYNLFNSAYSTENTALPNVHLFLMERGIHMRYELTKDLETGNATIDMEHRELFQAVNNLMDACKVGQGRSSVSSAAQFLLQYVDKHFTHEEQLQKSCQYPKVIPHKAFHDRYKRELKEITAQIPNRNVSVTDLVKLNNHLVILVNHIKVVDKELAAYLKAKS
jgi:hemerythrin